LLEVVVTQAKDEFGSGSSNFGTAIDGLGADGLGGVVGAGDSDGFILTQGIAGVGDGTPGKARDCYGVYLGGAGTSSGGELIQRRDRVESGVFVGSCFKHGAGLGRHRHGDGVSTPRDVLGVIELVGLGVAFAVSDLAGDVRIDIAFGVGDGGNLDSGVTPIDGEDKEVAGGVCGGKGQRQGFGGGAIAGIVAGGLHKGGGRGGVRGSGGGYNSRLIQVGGCGGLLQQQDAYEDRHYGEDRDVGGETFLGGLSK